MSPTPYTSARSGLWDASDVDTWGQGLGVYPNLAADVVTVAAGHTVTYNVSSAVELGQITLNGLLTFSVSMTTLLALGHQDILINNGGELRVGASGAVIPKAYLAEILWNTMADTPAKGINLAAGGKLYVYDDPDYYGSDYDAEFATVSGAIVGASKAAACVITWTGHNMITGDSVVISGITQAEWTALNGTRAITRIDNDTFSVAVNTSGYVLAYDPVTDPGILTRNTYWIPATASTCIVTVSGDFTTKWANTAAGRELLVHKGGNFAHYNNDFALLTITSLTLTGANTDIACTVTHNPGGAANFNAGGDVLFVSRNVKLGKLGASTNIGNNNTNRPRGTSANTVNGNVIIGGQWTGWYPAINAAINIQLNGGVFRNGGQVINGGSNIYPNIGIAFSNCVAYSNQYVTGYCAGYQYADCYLVNNYYLNQHGFPFNEYSNVAIFGNYAMDLSGIHSNSKLANCYLYANNHILLNYSKDVKFINCNIGYDKSDRAKTNAYDFRYNSMASFVNCLLPASPSWYLRNTAKCNGRFTSEHHQQTTDAHCVFDVFGDVVKVPADGTGDNPTQRSGGAANVAEVTPQSNCSSTNYLEILNVRVWNAAVAKTYRYYCQTTYATLPTAEISLTAEYLDEASGGHLATVTSTQGITDRGADQSDWSQYLEVTVPAHTQEGWVNLFIRLMGYEAGEKVWVDPHLEII